MACRIWLETPVEIVDLLRGALKQATQNSPTVAFIMIVDEDAMAPNSAVRSGLGDVFAEVGDKLNAWGGAVVGTGLFASSKRTMMRLIMSLGRVRCPWIVVSSADEAVAWVDKTLNEQQGPCASERWMQLLEGSRERVKVSV